MSNFNLSINTDLIKAQITKEIEESLTTKLKDIAERSIASDYTLGNYIKEHTKSFIQTNLKSLVEAELQSIDIKSKVDKAVDRAVLDIVHNYMKKLKL